DLQRRREPAGELGVVASAGLHQTALVDRHEELGDVDALGRAGREEALERRVHLPIRRRDRERGGVALERRLALVELGLVEAAEAEQETDLGVRLARVLEVELERAGQAGGIAAGGLHLHEGADRALRALVRLENLLVGRGGALQIAGALLVDEGDLEEEL